MELQEHYTITELNRRTKIGKNVLWQWVKSGWLRGTKLGRRVKYTASDLERAKLRANKEACSIIGRRVEPAAKKTSEIVSLRRLVQQQYKMGKCKK